MNKNNSKFQVTPNRVSETWQSQVFNSSKFLEMVDLRKRATELTAELHEVTSAIAEAEEAIEAAKRAEERTRIDLLKEKNEQQNVLAELMQTMKELERKIPVLAKEKTAAEEALRREKAQLSKYEDSLNKKRMQLETLREIVKMKKQNIEELQYDRRNMEKEYNERLERVITEEKEKRRLSYKDRQQLCQERIEAYLKEAKKVEQEVSSLNEERKLLQDMIAMYSERIPLLEEKHMLMVTEFRWLVNSELDDEVITSPGDADGT